MSDEQHDNQVENEILELIGKIAKREITEEEWQRFVELTHWEDDENE